MKSQIKKLPIKMHNMSNEIGKNVKYLLLALNTTTSPTLVTKLVAGLCGVSLFLAEANSPAALVNGRVLKKQRLNKLETLGKETIYLVK